MVFLVFSPGTCRPGQSDLQLQVRFSCQACLCRACAWHVYGLHAGHNVFAGPLLETKRRHVNNFFKNFCSSHGERIWPGCGHREQALQTHAASGSRDLCQALSGQKNPRPYGRGKWHALPVRAAKMCRLSEEDPAVRLPGLSQPSRESTAASAFSRSSLRVYIAVVAMAPASTARSSAKPAAGMMSGTASMGRMK